MECPRCSRTVEPDHNFCNGCGMRLRTDEGRSVVDDTDLAADSDVGLDAEVTDEHGVVVAETPQPETTRGSTSSQESPLASRSFEPTGGFLDDADADHTGELPVVADIEWLESSSEVSMVATSADIPTDETVVVEVSRTATTLDPTDGVDDDVSTAEAVADAHVDEVELTVDEETTPTGVSIPAYDGRTAEAVAVDYEDTDPSPGSPRSTAVIPSVQTVPSPTSMLPYTDHVQLPRIRRFRLTATAMLGLVVGALMVVVLFLPVLSVKSTVTVLLDNAAIPDGFRFGSWTIGSLGSNLPVAVLVCATLAVIGAIAAGYGKAWGAGLVGGASLSFVGIAALTIGLMQFPIDAAFEFAKIPTEVPIGLQIVREPGYWLLLGCSGLAVITMFSSLKECMSDRRRNLNPWFAAFGALSVVLLVVGAMIPINGAIISDNWFVIDGPGEAPQALVAGRLVQLGLLLVSGTVGFLLVRSYGLGLAIGGTLPSLWLGLSVLMTGGNPVGPGWRNPGETGMDVHPVTIIEMAAVLALLVLASLSAFGQQASGSPATAGGS